MSEDFSKRITDFGKSIWGKAQDTVDIVALNNEIAAKNRELGQLYGEIGRLFCINHQQMAMDEYPDQTNRALAMAKEMKELEEKVLMKKGNRKCPACGAMAPAAAAFCPACGAAMPISEEPPKEEQDLNRYCKQCGAKLEQDDVYCASCGARQTEESV